MSDSDGPMWLGDARTFGAGSGGWPTGPGMSARDVERRVAAALHRAAESIGVNSDALHVLAAHEGGHAVVARALGLPIAEVRIDADHGGVNRFHADRAPAGWSATEDAAVLLAGAVAERMLHPSTDLEGSDDDQAALLDLMARAEPPDVVRAKATVDAILAGRRGQLDALVDALIRQRHLTGAEVDELLAENRAGTVFAHAGSRVLRRRPAGVDSEREQFLARMESRVRLGIAGPSPRVSFRGRDCTAELLARGI